MPQIDFSKSEDKKINIQDKEILINSLSLLKKNINNFLPSIYQTITNFEKINDRKAQFLVSQIKLVLSLISNLPKDKYNEASKISISYLPKIIENLKDDNYSNVFSDISLWYNSIIEIISIDEKEIDLKTIAIDFKNKGRNAVRYPKKVKELNQLFTEYGNIRFKENSEMLKIPFLMKYLQQIFKEVSYDGGVLFNEESYDSFTKNFSKTCENIGIYILESDYEKIFNTIAKLYDYTFDLKEVLYENKFSKNK